jgi:hypothetical protein
MSHPKLLLFVDDLKVYREIKYFEDFKALKANIDSVQHWFVQN